MSRSASATAARYDMVHSSSAEIVAHFAAGSALSMAYLRVHHAQARPRGMSQTDKVEHDRAPLKF